MREQDIIRRYFQFPADNTTDGVQLGVGDDAAVLTPPDTPTPELVVSTDTLNVGIHFFPDTAPTLLARKAAAVSLSDIAAMGGRALWLLVALIAPSATRRDWFAAFADGLHASSREFGYRIVGGDLTRGNTLSITTTAIGICTHPPRTRAMAQPDDDLWLSGTVGGAAHALGVAQGRLAAADADAMRAADTRLHDPTPRLTQAAALAPLVHAMMDISDGLLNAAETIAAASAVQVQLDSEAVAAAAPPSLRVLTAHAARQCQLCGGDDYELLFTAPPAAAAHIRALATESVPLTRIGRITANTANPAGCVTDLADGQPLTMNGGYSHDFG